MMNDNNRRQLSILRYTDFNETEEKGGEPEVYLIPENLILFPTKCTAKTQYRKFERIFLEKELRGHSPNFHIHVSVSDLYIPTIDLHFLLQEICGPILGIYKSLTDT